MLCKLRPSFPFALAMHTDVKLQYYSTQYLLEKKLLLSYTLHSIKLDSTRFVLVLYFDRFGYICCFSCFMCNKLIIFFSSSVYALPSALSQQGSISVLARLERRRSMLSSKTGRQNKLRHSSAKLDGKELLYRSV